jgi:hypothetical protein
LKNCCRKPKERSLTHAQYGRKEKIMIPQNPALPLVKEIKETRDIKEVVKLLNSGNWIAICATSEEIPLFSLGRVV